MLRQPTGSIVTEALLKQYEYDAIETCAADGTCSLSCPVGIDTGKLIKDLRTRQHGERGEKSALKAAEHWSTVERGARAGLRVGRMVGDSSMGALTGLARNAVGQELIPAWGEAMPGPAGPMPASGSAGSAAAVYFPACVNRIFGNPRAQADGPSLPQALLSVSARAGKPLFIPPDVAGNCCATPWASKGYEQGQAHMARKVAASVLRWTHNGRLPLVVDASSCTLGLISEVPAALGERERAAFEQVQIVDSIAWVHDSLLEHLEVRRKLPSVAVHPPCAASHLGLSEQLASVVRALADEVIAPDVPTCCGTAGDRGLLHPELPAAAMSASSAELAERSPSACVCSNRTCEIGLTQASGRDFGSFVLLLERLTRG